MKIGDIITQIKMDPTIVGCVASRPIQGKVTKMVGSISGLKYLYG